MAQTAGWQTTMKMFTYARKGTLSQQAPGKGLKINPQVSNLRTAQCRTQKRATQTENEGPTNSDDKTRPAGLLPRNLPNLPNPPHVCDWWLKMQKQNVCLFASFVLDMTANMPHCKIKCKTSQTECSHNHKSKPKNNHVASNAFVAAFKILLAKVVLYLAVSDQFTSFMTACESTHLHCPKFWFMIITNGRELEVNPRLLPTAGFQKLFESLLHTSVLARQISARLS